MSVDQVTEAGRTPGSRRFGRTLKVVLASLAAVVGVVLVPASANAATAISAAGAYGGVREAATPAVCYNSAYGYIITADGPAAWGVKMPGGETAQYVRWDSRLYDATTGKYVYDPGYSNWGLASTTLGIQFGNDLLYNGIRGHVLQVENTIEWWSPAAGGITGIYDYKDSSYYIADQLRYATSC